MESLFKLAVTGGIATGKSTVCRGILAAFPPGEAVFFDADASVHQLLTTPAVVGMVAESLGQDVLASDGTLDRKRVSQLVFQNPAHRQSLEAILHPMVRGQAAKLLEQAQTRSDVRLFLADIPLLYETGFPLPSDAQLLVACGPATQRERLLARTGARDPHLIDQRLAAQLPILEKITRASSVIWNGGNLHSLDQQIALFLTWLKPKLK
jgi:dephospho-CoA kinase